MLANSALSMAADADLSVDTGDFEDVPNLESTDGIATAETVDVAQTEPVVEVEKGLSIEKVAQEIEAEVGETSEEPTDNEQFIARLKEELDLTKTDYQQLLNSVTEARKKLELIGEEKMSLSEQMNNLRLQESMLTAKLVTVLQQIVTKENAIKTMDEEVEGRTIAVEYQKELLKDYVRMIYQEENDFFQFGDDQANAFKLLLSEGNVGDNLRKLDYFNLMNETGLQIISKLDEMNQDLAGKQEKLAADKEELEKLRLVLVDQKEQLELQKEAQMKLLDITEGQEEVYQQLIDQEFDHQEELVTEIQALRDIYMAAEKKYLEDPENFNPEDYDISKLKDSAKNVYNFQVDNLGKGDCQFDWPVEPTRGVSTFFRNEGDGYYQRFGMQHNALDIPVWQGSAVHAPAEGVVYVAKDNGYGYSYIILSHACGFSTTYGHMSEILVKEGQYVEAGGIIGLSGGMPGSKGAGYMTTGPHLHFEMRMNGLYVDPMEYMPLEELERDDLLEKYQAAWDLNALRLTRKDKLDVSVSER